MSRAAWALNVGWSEDGWPHMRDEQTGTCGNCGARAGEGHYKLKPPTAFGLPVTFDDTIPPGTAVFKDADGNITGYATGLR